MWTRMDGMPILRAMLIWRLHWRRFSSYARDIFLTLENGRVWNRKILWTSFKYDPLGFMSDALQALALAAVRAHAVSRWQNSPFMGQPYCYPPRMTGYYLETWNKPLSYAFWRICCCMKLMTPYWDHLANFQMQGTTESLSNLYHISEGIFRYLSLSHINRAVDTALTRVFVRRVIAHQVRLIRTSTR